jgi:hypothetical protein
MRNLLLVLVLVSGCSLTFQSRPTADRVTSCSTTSAYWIADSVGVVASVATLVASFFVKDSQAEYAAPAAVTSVIYLASTGNGYRWARDCRAQH